MSYLLKRPFHNMAQGTFYKPGTMLASLPWLNAEQIQSCIDEGSLEQITIPPLKPEPDDLKLLPHIDEYEESLLNKKDIFTYADVLTRSMTILPRVGTVRAMEIKSAAGKLANVVTA